MTKAIWIIADFLFAVFWLSMIIIWAADWVEPQRGLASLAAFFAFMQGLRWIGRDLDG